MSASDDLTLHRSEAPPRVLFPARALVECKETKTPRSGWYFAFRIDLEATLPCLPAETISAFCNSSKVYVGYLAAYDGLPHARREFNRAYVVLLSTHSIPNDMAVAVSPNDAVIAGRNPLQSEPPLPWTGAYHVTVEGDFPAVRIPPRRLNCVKKYELPHDERWALSSYHREDIRKQRDIDAAPTDSLPKLAHEDHHQVSSTLPEDAVSLVPSQDEDDAPSSGEFNQAKNQAVDGDPLSVENVTGQPAEPSHLDVAFQTILDVTTRHVEHDRYAPILEVITYDLETVSNVGTPAEFRLEISQIEKLIPEHERWAKVEQQRQRRAFLSANRRSLSPERYPLLAKIPTCASSVPPYLDRVIPLSAAEWQDIVDQSAHDWEGNTSKAYACRQRAEDLRQAAEVWEDYGAAYDRKAAENHKDGENAKILASFLGVDMAPMHETDVQPGDSSVVLDRARLPHSEPPPEQGPLDHELREGGSFDELSLDHKQVVVKRTSRNLALSQGKVIRLTSTELPQSEEPPEADARISLAGGLTLQIDSTSVEVTTSAALEVIPPARFGSPVGVRLGRSETVNLGHKRRRESAEDNEATTQAQEATTSSRENSSKRSRLEVPGIAAEDNVTHNRL